MKDKYIVIQMWDSCDPIVVGIFKSQKQAEKWVKKYRWSSYDQNNDLINMFLSIDINLLLNG